MAPNKKPNLQRPQTQTLNPKGPKQQTDMATSVRTPSGLRPDFVRTPRPPAFPALCQNPHFHICVQITVSKPYELPTFTHISHFYLALLGASAPLDPLPREVPSSAR